MPALLNDGATLSIAYDNVRYKDQLENWNMSLVLGTASVLGLFGPFSALGLFYLGDNVSHLDHAHLQTQMYLTLSVAGHLTIFVARHAWSLLVDPPCSGSPTGGAWHASAGDLRRRLRHVHDTTRLGTCGTRLGRRTGIVRVTDRVKLLVYPILDPVTTATPFRFDTADCPQRVLSSINGKAPQRGEPTRDPTKKADIGSVAALSVWVTERQECLESFGELGVFAGLCNHEKLARPIERITSPCPSGRGLLLDVGTPSSHPVCRCYGVARHS